MIKNPTTADAAMPARHGPTPNAAVEVCVLVPSRIIAPKIVGTHNIKEYFNTNLRENPLK